MSGPLTQAGGIAFRLAVLATLALAVVWASGNVRKVPPGQVAVVARFGRVVQVQGAGLLLALPEPLDRVTLLPGPDEQLSLTVASPREASLRPVAGSAGTYLTGDGGVVLLDATIGYRVADPGAFLLAQTHVEPALGRFFRAAAAETAARHILDDFLVTDPSRPAAGRAAASARLRQDMLDGLNGRLVALGASGPGIEITRLDLQANLPTEARQAFNAVLTAAQTAQERIATAETDAVHMRQEAQRNHDRWIDVARANAAERVANARAQTAAIPAVAASMTEATRDSVLDTLYRTRIAAILRKAGDVTAVDPRPGPRVILPGGKP